MDLKAIYLTTLERCAPETLVRTHVTPAMPRNVVAIGKCAGALLDGVASAIEIESAFVAIPDGYRLPRTRADTHIGGHPHMTPASFAAGRALLEYIDAHDDILFLVSGGGSACVEVPLPPFSDEDVAHANEQLIASGKTIGEINAARRSVSAIKGGKLAQRVRGRAVTLVYSDVSTGNLEDVASGPTLPGSEAILIADNTTLVRAAAEIIGRGGVSPASIGRHARSESLPGKMPDTSGRDARPPRVIEEQIEGDVEEAARFLAARARELRRGEILVAGGEPTVVVRGTGRGGRCSELSVRFAAHSECEALFASSDGVDGNSGVAGIYLPGRPEGGEPAGWQPALERSDSFAVASQIGEPIMIAPTGNNLRDLFLVAAP